ncbi:hypothetical protein BDV24DRAFT_176801 [Aspergillus arachidicola]|uniref:Protein kinase domain-containing protein n=1 Tax=Aspergillus arachidicola TaxID=656916 RepID=A0A5N6XYT3_9EURO|nr:hypothetical protein BDV24DRAFT_176801 [Aspergillus arachidicola]
MLSVIRPTLSAERNSLSRIISSLAPGYTLQGSRWDYRILTPIEGDNTHISTVFNPKVNPRENAEDTPKTPQWAVIKVASPGDAIAKENMDRECQTYHLPDINSAACFREMYDVIESSTIALEWRDTTLAEVKYQSHMHIYSLIAAVLRAALTSCVLLEGHQHVNTDLKPANILLSGIETRPVTAKVGDLRLVVPVASLFNAQPYALRAPEVFLGQPCKEPLQVWAVATMLLCRINLVFWAWCMAKIKRLFPHWRIQTPNEVQKYSLKVALQVILPFDQEIQKVEMPQQLRDLLRFMLVVNPVDRPSPSSVLASREFRSFEKLVKLSCS